VSLFSDQLHRASWRGVPHDYPYRDTVWLEDQGKLPRRFRMLGFLIANSAVYGGGDVSARSSGWRRRPRRPGRRPGPSHARPADRRPLIEPGDHRARWDEGGFAEVDFTFIQGGDAGLPGGRWARSATWWQGRRPGRRRRPLGLRPRQGAAAAEAAGLGAVTRHEPRRPASWIDKVEASAATPPASTARSASWAARTSAATSTAATPASWRAWSAPTRAQLGRRPDLTGAAKRARSATAGDLVTAAIGEPRRHHHPGGRGHRGAGHVAALQASAADPADAVRILSSLAASRPQRRPAPRRGSPSPTSSSARPRPPSPGQRHLCAGLGRRRARRARRGPGPDRGRSRRRATPASGRGLRGLARAAQGRGRGPRRARRRAGPPAEIELATNLPAVVIAQRRYADATAPTSWSSRPTRSIRGSCRCRSGPWPDP
jgi:hypothetical protein